MRLEAAENRASNAELEVCTEREVFHLKGYVLDF